MSKSMNNITQAIEKAKEEYMEEQLKIMFGIDEDTLPISDISPLDGLHKMISEIDRNCIENKDNDRVIYKDDISSLKKRIKYCKNPMERKRLQQELNSLYKEQKGRKKR